MNALIFVYVGGLAIVLMLFVTLVIAGRQKKLHR